MSFIAVAIRAVSLVVIVRLASGDSLQRSFEHLRPGWIGVVAAAELLTYPAYLLAYQSLARLEPHARLGTTTMALIVVAGFGPLALSGGFGIDRHALQAVEGEGASAQSRVGAMATMEWAVLAPATWVVALLLLATGAHISGSLTWPWAVGVPVAIGAAVWAIAPGRATRLSQPRGRRVALLAHVLDGIRAVKTMADRPWQYRGVWVGTALYWAAEICAFYAALRTAGLNLGLERSVLAYATGYLASRRSLPLGGAGLTEALLIYSLYALREPLGPAIAAVLIYRVFNFLVVVIPALVAYHKLAPRLLAR